MSNQPIQQINIRRQVPNQVAGARFDRVAAELFPDFSRSRLQAWIKSGELSADGQQLRQNSKLHGGEWLELHALVPLEGLVEPQPIPLDLIHEDRHILLVNKPAGLVVHPAAGNPDGTLQNALLHFDPGLDALPRAGIVHRLDKDTTGIMVVARSLAAHKHLVSALQERVIKREYRAVVRREITAGGTVDAPIGRHPRNRKRMAVIPGGKKAVSHYRIIQRFPGFTLLSVRLETGRTHQIRVHLSHIGFPLTGDPVYGGRKRIPAGIPQQTLRLVAAFPRQALHAIRLSFPHPADGRDCRYSAPVPEDLKQLIKALGSE